MSRRRRAVTGRRGRPVTAGGDGAAWWSRTSWQLAACALLALGSLALPAGLGYDPWAWLVWGREVTQGALDTAGGPSWKPLPVLVTTPLSLLGQDVAPLAWSVIARAGGLFGLVLAFRLAARFAGPAAGALAAAGVVLSPDAEARWIRHLSQSNVEPLTAALCLWAVERHLDDRHGHALALLGLAGLSRPEAWPFLLAYAAWLVRRDRTWWRLAVPVLVAIPLLWFGGDWVGSGSPLVGAERAQVLDAGTADRAVGALRRIGEALVLPAWAGVVAALVIAHRRRDPVPWVLTAAALAWCAEVWAMTALLGYAGLGRFLQPAAAVLCVVAGVGVVQAVRAVGSRRWRAVAAVAVVVTCVPLAWPRAAWLGTQAAEAAERARTDQQLAAVLAEAGGRAALVDCAGGVVAIDDSRPALESRPSVAWKAQLALSEVQHRISGRSVTVIAYAGGALEAELAALPTATTDVVARHGRWLVVDVRCDQQLGSG